MGHCCICNGLYSYIHIHNVDCFPPYNVTSSAPGLTSDTRAPVPRCQSRCRAPADVVCIFHRICLLANRSAVATQMRYKLAALHSRRHVNQKYISVLRGKCIELLMTLPLSLNTLKRPNTHTHTNMFCTQHFLCL